MNTDIKYLNFCETKQFLIFFFRTLMYSNKKYLPSLLSLINLLILCSSGSNGALFCWTFIRYFSEQNTLLKVIRISTSDSMNF